MFRPAKKGEVPTKNGLYEEFFGFIQISQISTLYFNVVINYLPIIFSQIECVLSLGA